MEGDEPGAKQSKNSHAEEMDRSWDLCGSILAVWIDPGVFWDDQCVLDSNTQKCRIDPTGVSARRRDGSILSIQWIDPLSSNGSILLKQWIDPLALFLQRANSLEQQVLGSLYILL